MTGILLVTGGVYALMTPPSAQAPSFHQPYSAQPAAAEPNITAERNVDQTLDDDQHPGQPRPSAVSIAPSPTRLSFPNTSVTADVVPVATMSSGAMQLPEDPAQVGWWVGGAAPGDPQGTTVLAGHIAGLGRSGAMSVLLDVEAGQLVDVQDRGGGAHLYRVVARSEALKQDLDPALFTTAGPPRLVLITCGGIFNEQTGHYSDNIVVIAEPVAP